jgi:transcription elongation factor GreA
VTQQTSESVTWLTQAAYDRLREELAYLTGEGRAQIVRRIESAREEGDLRENGGYHAAKEEQGKQEVRIRQLQALLHTAKVGEAPADDGVVEPGMLVTVRLAGDEMSFLLGSREVASDDIEVYSEKSPLGGAIIGRRIGDAASYTAPTGREISVEILDARPFTG